MSEVTVLTPTGRTGERLSWARMGWMKPSVQPVSLLMLQTIALRQGCSPVQHREIWHWGPARERWRVNAQALAGAPRIGTALPVVQHGTRSLTREVPLPAAGAWVKLRNLAATLVDGQLQVRQQLHTAGSLHSAY